MPHYCQAFAAHVLAVIFLALVPVGIVQASPIRMDFSGTILPGAFATTYSGGSPVVGNWDNRPFSGSFVFDPATALNDYINPELTHHFSNDGHPSAPWMLTTLSMPDGVVVSGDHLTEFQS